MLVTRPSTPAAVTRCAAWPGAPPPRSCSGYRWRLVVEGRLKDAELAADRAAIRRVGRPSLARALRATAIPTRATAAVGFDGAGPAHVTQLPGDQPPPAASADRLPTIGASA